MNVSRPSSVEEASAAGGELRAGGTDVEARRRIGKAEPRVVHLGGVSALRGIEPTEGGGVRIGALTRLGALPREPRLVSGYPALVRTVAGVATPHVRSVATLGGSLLQRTRCPYYRHPAVSCFKSGGEGCPARDGDHRLGVVFDRGPCIAVHPSSVGMALLLYDAVVTVHGAPSRSVEALYGDGSDPTRDHLLEPGALLTSVLLPAPNPGETAAYRRVAGRVAAEWPLVEAVCRLVVEEGRIVLARVAAGAVAPTPLRLRRVEQLLEGREAVEGVAVEAAAEAARGASPLPQTRYKVALVQNLVADVVAAALAGSDDLDLAVHERPLGG